MADQKHFELFHERLDTLDEILAEGPTDTPGEFINALRNSINDLGSAVELITAEDVDEEYEDEDEESEV